MFYQPPAFYSAGGLWEWGLVVFINCIFVYVFLGLVEARYLHLAYLTQYYFFENRLLLRENLQYSYKLTISGEQFTRRKGAFALNDPSTGRIYCEFLDIEFPEADVEKEKISTVIKRGNYKADKTYKRAYFEIFWPDEFQEHGASVPSVQVEFRQKIPRRVKSAWNVFFFPVFYVMNLFVGDKFKTYQKFGQYTLLSVMFFTIHFSWIVVIIFTVLSLIPWEDFGYSRVHSMFWGSLTTKPAVTMASYVIFMILILTTFLVNLIAFASIYRSTRHRGSTSLTKDHEVQPSSTYGELSINDYARDVSDVNNTDTLSIEYFALGSMHPGQIEIEEEED